MTLRRQARSAAQDGYSLIELLVGLAILAAVALLAVPLTRTAAATQALRSTAAEFAAAVRATRAAALRAGAQRSVTIDLASRRYWTEGGAGPRQLPSRLALEVVVPPGEQSHVLRQIRFLPGGGSSGGRLVLRDGTKAAVVEVDWLTGGVSVGTSP